MVLICNPVNISFSMYGIYVPFCKRNLYIFFSFLFHFKFTTHLCFVCWFVWIFSTHSICFTHFETSPFSLIKTPPLPVKGCKSWPLLGSHGHWAVRVLLRVTPNVTRASVYCQAFPSFNEDSCDGWLSKARMCIINYPHWVTEMHTFGCNSF